MQTSLFCVYDEPNALLIKLSILELDIFKQIPKAGSDCFCFWNFYVFQLFFLFFFSIFCKSLDTEADLAIFDTDDFDIHFIPDMKYLVC